METTSRRPWTDDEIGYVTDTLDLPPAEVVKNLDRSYGTVKDLRKKLRSGWQPTKAPWTTEEDTVISASGRLTSIELSKLLPGRSADAIKKRRIALGVPLAGHWAPLSPLRPAGRALVAKTCRKCGLLLPGSWFYFNKKQRVHQAECKSCHVGRNEERIGSISKQSEATRRSYQAITLKAAERNGQPYTERDDEVLRNPSFTVFEKALLLRRSFAAVSTQLARSGYKVNAKLGNPEVDRWIIANPNVNSLGELISQVEARWDWDDAA